MIAVTGATGQLGRLVIDSLLRQQPDVNIAAIVRNPEKAQDLKARGVEVRYADYDKPETLPAALKGVDKLLLISGSVIGRRYPQHEAAIRAAESAGVGLLVYTSLLHADTSPMAITDEHKQTEALLAKSSVPNAILRNGWYTENETAGLPGAIANGAYIGASGDGRISWAPRADYAEAAARVLLSPAPQAGRIYELAGDEALTMTDLAAATSQLAGRPVAYRNVPEAELASALRSVGLPEAAAAMLADSSARAAKGALRDDSRTLSQLIGRPTTPVRDTVAATLKAAGA